MSVKWCQCRDCWRPFKQLARLARHKARLTFFLDRVLTMISFVFFLLATCFSIWGDAQTHMICRWYDTFFRRYIRELVVELGGVEFWLFEVKSAKAFWTDQIWFRIKRDLADIMSLLGVYEKILVHSCRRVVCIESALFGIQYFMFITNFKRPISWEFKDTPQCHPPRKEGLIKWQCTKFATNACWCQGVKCFLPLLVHWSTPWAFSGCSIGTLVRHTRRMPTRSQTQSNQWWMERLQMTRKS